VLDIEKPELFMSVVVPAYNEEERLIVMLEETVDYLEHAYGTLADQASNDQGKGKKGKNGSVRQRKTGNGHIADDDASKGWEILLVSDGSTDRTEEVAFEFARDHQLSLHPGSIRVITLTQNRGKGGAVTHGMRHVRGKYVIFADADGASKFSDLGKLVSACQEAEDSEGRAVAVGSRAHMVGSEAVVKVRIFILSS
jgi:dolichyl-phosphate beta-glucosyltransferase